MATIHFLGTCSGTEPMPGMHQSSLIIESGGEYYWFDAGECCGYTAYLLGMDPLRTRAIFLSHMHIDHTAGLPHLFFCIQKMMSRRKEKVVHENAIDVCAPNTDVVRAAMKVTSPSGALPYTVHLHSIRDGVVYQDEHLRVTAQHNTHLGEDGSNGWHAFSFLIEVDGKRVVHSGDVGKPEELDPLLENGCDLLIMETGHHKVKDVCEYAMRHGVTRLRFHHHGREIINDRPAAEALVASYPYDYQSAFDGLRELI